MKATAGHTFFFQTPGNGYFYHFALLETEGYKKIPHVKVKAR